MGKQKGFRKIQGTHKKLEKKEVKSSKLHPTLQSGPTIKNIESLIEEEIEFAFWRKKMSKSFRKELERYPLLARAVYIGCERAVDELLEVAEDVNVRIQDGSTPLMIAVDKGHITILQKLLKAGADLRLARNNGMNALMTAVWNNDNRAFSLLWDHLDKNDFWILNQENSEGSTILTIAVERGYVEYAKFFCGLSVVKVDHQTSEGKTALMMAAMRSQQEIIRSLLERGASVLLEDMVGATVLCAAFVQEQPEIAEMLLGTLNKKDRDIYVKKRVELLYRQRASSSFETIDFYKIILFRVILAIKRQLKNGIELLIKYKIFFPLLKCIEMYKIDSELVWQAFHLAACLIYDSNPNDTLVLKDMAELYAEARGLDLSLQMFNFFKNNPDVKDAAFLPVQAYCIECCHGKLWLKVNFDGINEHVIEFKKNLPMLKCWLQDEFGRAKMVFECFEMVITRVITEKADSIPQQVLPTTCDDSLDSPDCSLECKSLADSFVDSAPTSTETRPSRVSSASSMCSVSNQMKKKAEISRKVKNIKFHTKFEKKSKTNGTSSQKISMNFPIEVFQNSSKRLNLPALNSQTGYADALKRNLNHKTESELNVGQLVLKDSGNFPRKREIENESSANQKILGGVTNYTSDCLKQRSRSNAKGDINEKFANKFKSYASVVSEKKEIKSTKSLTNVKNVSIAGEGKNGKVNEKRSIWNKVKEPCNLFSFISKLYPSLSSSDNQKPSPQITCDDEKECPESSKNSLNEETEVNDETEILTDKAIDLKENDVTEDVSSEEKIPPESNKIALPATKDCSFDFESKEKHIEEEAENLYCLFESLSIAEQDQENIAVNYSAGDMNFDRYTEEELSRNRASKSDKDENVLKHLHETGDTLHEKVDSETLDSKNGRIDEKYRKVSDQTYCEVARMNMDRRAEIDQNIPEDEVSENQNELVKLEQDYLSLNSSFESLELENVCKQVAMELNSKKPCSDIENKDERLETGVTDLNIHFEETSEDVSEDLVQCRDSPIHKHCYARRLAESHSNERTIHNDQKNEKFAPDFNQFISEVKERNETNDVKENTTKHSESSINGNFVIETLNSNRKLRCLESIRQRIITIEDLNISPITCELRLLSLQKYLTLYQRLFLLSVCSDDAQNIFLAPYQTKTDVGKSATKSKNLLVQPLKKKITVFTDGHRIPNIIIKVGKKSAVGVGSHLSEESNYIKIFDKLSKVGTLKIHKYHSDLSQRKTKNFIPRSDTEFKRKTAREDTLERRRTLMSGHYSNCERVRNLESGLKPNFINCERDSRWYHALKGLQLCVPLGQFLSVPFSRDTDNSPKDSNIRRLDSSSGKIVFGTNTECTLRDGSFGTYTGLIVNTGTPVRIRQFGVSSFINDKAALSLSKNRLLEHGKLCAFYDAVINPKDFKMYLVSELCEYSLPQYLKMSNICHSQSRVPAHFFRKLFVIDLVEGVRYLHRSGIVHGHLKPSNIMMTSDYKLKIADYYLMDVIPLNWGIRILDPKIQPIGESISKFCWRPTELILAENETEARNCITAASDIQMCGMLIFYILTGGKHPFGSSERECQENMKQGQPTMEDSCLEDTEARDLVSETIKADVSSRPTIDLVVKHPYFWDINRRFQFLLQVGRKITFYTSRPTRAADEFKESCIEARDWIFYIPRTVIDFVSNCTNTVYKNEFADLLLFAVALQENFDFMPRSLSSAVLIPSHFVLLTFPTFFMSIFHVIRRNPVLQKQMGLQAYF